MKKKSHYANAFSNWVALGINALLAFIMTPIVIRYIGQEGYGLWVILLSIIGYAGFLDLGITSALLRYIARYAAQKDESSLNETVNTALAIFCTTGFFLVLSSFFITIPLANFLNIVETNLDDFTRAVQLLSFVIFLRFVAGVFRCSLIAHEYFIASNSVEILSSLIRAGTTFYLLANGWGIIGIAVSHTITTTFMVFCHFTLCKIFIPAIKLQFKSINKATRNRLLTFGGVTLIISATDMIRLNMDSFIIAKMVGLTSVSIYAVAALLVNNFRQLVVSALGIFNPKFAALDGQGDNIKLIQVFMQSLFICGLIAFSLGSSLIFFGGDFIKLWVGDKFTEAIPILIILIAGNTVAVSQSVSLSIMYAMKKHKWYAMVSTVEAFFNLTLSIILAYKYGILGVALGTVIPMICISGIFQPFYVSKLLHIPVTMYIAYLLPGALLGISIVSSIAFIGSLFISSATYITLGGQIALATTTTIIFLMLISRKSQHIQQSKLWKINPKAPYPQNT